MSRFAVLAVLCSAASFTAAGGYTLLPKPIGQRVQEIVDPACKIKGNVSINTGERIYHVPGQEHYDETRIDYAYGERWFCSEAEARAAGWRKSRT
ncbi:sunset domain-containing protein [Rhizobium rhizogenes]|uniref:sunset domain-containing protein n=1 Tax=Rhizobium rhizogenes TaxID=359 RepID=UPI0024BE8CF7|nr:hypothetical protein [Rhizobium rhizogenes]MDJ1632665.1 hypothetical protein [Rhizobium rhizogenes]